MGFGNSKSAFVNNFYPLIKNYMSIDNTLNLAGKYIVRYLQTTLNNVYRCNLVVDGIYGKATKSVVKQHYLKI